MQPCLAKHYRTETSRKATPVITEVAFLTSEIQQKEINSGYRYELNRQFE